MGDVTFGVKVPEELKEQIQKLMSDSGLAGKDFMQQIINTYTVEKTKENIPQVAEDLKELQTLTQRINNIYLNLGYRIETITKAQQEQTQKDLQAKDAIITDFQDKIEILKNENDTLNSNYNIVVNNEKELNNRVNELTENNNNIKALIEEYKEKNDMLLSQMRQFEKYPEQLEATKELLADSQGKNIELNNSVKEKDSMIEKLNNEILLEKNNKENIIKELNIKHDEANKTLKEKAEFEKNNSILELKSKHQEELQQLQHKNNKEIEEYQNKYKKLLEELEKNTQKPVLNKRVSTKKTLNKSNNDTK